MASTDNAWAWALQSILSDFLTRANLNPYRVVGYPKVEVSRRPDKRMTLTVHVSFEMEHQI